MRPTVYLGVDKRAGSGKKPSARWSNVDRSLAEALVVYEASLNEVGTPSWVAQDPDRKFAPDEIVDEQMAVIEEHQAALQKNDDGKSYGLRVIAVEVPVDHRVHGG